MVPVQKSLEKISTGFTIFEPDQVLTDLQLNTVADFADDQIRLTRVRLLGVGVICGLRVSLSGTTVTVSAGTGVTTDGDLLYFDGDTTFERFQAYDRSFPAYAPLYLGGDVSGEMIAAYALVPTGTTGDPGSALSDFAAETGRELASMTAMLLMESYVKDDDLCSGTDCDNLGKEAVNTAKLLLFDRTAAEPLRETIATPGQAFWELPPIAAGRPALPATLASVSDLAAVYRPVCANTHLSLTTALGALPPACEAFLADAVGGGAVEGWTSRLNEYRSSFTENGEGIQYYYDFLKDLVEAYEELRESLFGDATLCGPPLDGFPKHLLLGDLTPATPEVNRTGFYPSPLTSRTAGELEQAAFLARRIGVLIQNYVVDPRGEVAIRVTPSAFEDRPLEERAIPFYYWSGIDGVQIPSYWSYRLVSRGREGFTYSYHAADLGETAAFDPLASQIGRFPFFRVEGHVGKPVASALTDLEGQIAARNLPFTVRSVLLGTERAKVVKKPGIHHTDLHHFHYVLRQDAVRRLDETDRFSGALKTRVNAAIDAGTVIDLPAENEGLSLRAVATQKSATISGKVATASAKLNRSYAAYRADTSWQADLSDTVRTAGEFKHNLASVAKTEFNTPFDTLIGATHVDWLPWIDDILGEKEKKEDDRLIFSKFAEEHPQVEHFGGVTRGGTLVLLYDDAGTVVGDVMLPYHCPEPPKDEAVEPPLQQPGLRPSFVLEEGVKISPSRKTFFDRKLLEFEPRIDLKIDQQAKYFDAFRTSYVSAFKDTVVALKPGAAAAQVATPYNDPFLGALVDTHQALVKQLDLAQQQAAKPDLSQEQKQFFNDQVLVAEQGLAQSVQKTADYVAKAGVDVAAGTEGFTAMMGVSGGLAKLSQGAVAEQAKASLGATMGATQNLNLKLMLGGMLGH
jgi:hypothetical protein